MDRKGAAPVRCRSAAPLPLFGSVATKEKHQVTGAIQKPGRGIGRALRLYRAAASRCPGVAAQPAAAAGHRRDEHPRPLSHAGAGQCRAVTPPSRVRRPERGRSVRPARCRPASSIQALKFRTSPAPRHAQPGQPCRRTATGAGSTEGSPRPGTRPCDCSGGGGKSGHR